MNKKSISSFSLLLPLTILFFTIHPHHTIAIQSTSTDLIAKVCMHSAHKDICIASLESEPASQKADLHGLALIALRLATSNATDTSTYIIQSLKNATIDPVIEQCLSDCSEHYLGATEQLDDSLAALTARGYGDVNTWVKAAIADAQACEDGFKEQGVNSSVLSHRNNMFKQLCNNALAAIHLLAQG